ncbi:rRNA maturation RNase YbeY [Kocuria rhizophila]|uniref:Endoribonuclease YbeY n=1 Tax=Kocuria rhizophila TaxID=72000 RepID=A0AAX2SCD2_KOCRH|nr:metal-dependent hydrolase [Kocuria rhizophila]OFK07823.1 rRNA maturation RNase YbeY [Kocuria sp. HMSC066H03]KUP27112.1 rRNA maturation RNase YbeY [Kocuria rhizophila]MDR7373809.1 putative rRNA maturation factor [Kocuria rhizophila]PKZ37144.1 rRNA maturation RNase YbeY [Kocuria rhizophila]
MSVAFDLPWETPEDQAVLAPCWRAVDTAQLSALVELAFRRWHLHPDTEVSIAVVDEEQMAQLHEQWLELPGATDVMSFPMDELREGTPEEPSLGVLGDVVLCPPVAQRQAEAAGHSTEDELCLLTAHSLLHLLGHDHAEEDERERMFRAQRALLEEFLGRDAPVETMS